MCKRLIKFYILVTGCWLLVTGICFAQPYQIAVIKSQAHPLYENALIQIDHELRKEIKDLSFMIFILTGIKEKDAEILREIKRQKVNLILTFGTSATEIAKENEKTIPVVFSFVLNPVASGLIPSFLSSRSNLSGVALDIPIEEQFSNFKLVVPSLITIAVFYNPAETGILIAEAEKMARRMGLTLKAIPIYAPDELPQNLKNLRGVDGLWMVADSVVFTPRNTEYILLYTLKERLPFMGASEQFVKAGALCGKMLDFEALNLQTVKQIRKIIKGENPRNLPVLLPESIDLALNLKVAEKIGHRIPASTLGKAAVIYR